MPRSFLPTRDPRSGATLDLVDPAWVRWTSAATWDGVVAERLHFERFEPCEFQVPAHCVLLPLSTASVEFWEPDGVRTRRLAPGQICVFPAGAPRRLRHGAFDVLAIALSRAFVGRTASGLGHAADPELAEHHGVADARAEHIGRALLAEGEAGAPSGGLYAESLATALAVHLLRAYGIARPARTTHRGGLAPCRLKRLTAYVHDHLAEDLRITALADVAGLSPCRFAHNFKQTTGIAPHRWVVQTRLERARALLRETDRAIATVACDTGFGSASRFSVLFRREHGTTPSAYRASFR